MNKSKQVNKVKYKKRLTDIAVGIFFSILIALEVQVTLFAYVGKDTTIIRTTLIVQNITVLLITAASIFSNYRQVIKDKYNVFTKFAMTIVTSIVCISYMSYLSLIIMTVSYLMSLTNYWTCIENNKERLLDLHKIAKVMIVATIVLYIIISVCLNFQAKYSIIVFASFIIDTLMFGRCKKEYIKGETIFMLIIYIMEIALRVLGICR